MSAERLRQAASVIRVAANGAVPVLPEFNRWGVTRDPLGTHVENGDGKGRIAMLIGGDRLDGRDIDTANHIALWSPPVALAVADWLDNEAAFCDDTMRGNTSTAAWVGIGPAFALADLILGAGS